MSASAVCEIDVYSCSLHVKRYLFYRLSSDLSCVEMKDS